MVLSGVSVCKSALVGQMDFRHITPIRRCIEKQGTITGPSYYPTLEQEQVSATI
jgi:hypothetical protein